MTTDARRRSPALALLEKYYEPHERKHITSPPIETKTPEWTRSTLSDLRAFKASLKREIECLEQEEADCIYQKYTLLNEGKPFGAFSELQIGNKIDSLEEHVLRGLSSKSVIVSGMKEYQSKVSSVELRVYSQLETLVKVTDEIRDLISKEELKLASERIRCLLLVWPTTLDRFPFVLQIKERIVTLGDGIIEIVLLKISADVSASTLSNTLPIVEDILQVHPSHEEKASNAIQRIYEIIKRWVNTLCEASYRDVYSVSTIKENVLEASKIVHWSFPTFQKMIRRAEKDIFDRYIPSILAKEFFSISSIVERFEEFKEGFSNESDPSYNTVLSSAFRRTVSPILTEALGSEVFEIETNLGMICADLLRCDPREEIVYVFESSIIDELVLLATTTDDLRTVSRLSALHSRIRTNVIMKLLRMVSAEMVGDATEIRKPVDDRLEQIALSLRLGQAS
jgi:hypothetical protein